MASRYVTQLQQPTHHPCDEIYVLIEERFQEILSQVNTRKLTLLAQLSVYRQEYDAQVATKNRIEQELYSTMQQMETVRDNDFVKILSEFVSSNQQHVERLQEYIANFKLRFDCEQLEDKLNQFGSISKVVSADHSEAADHLDLTSSPTALPHGMYGGLVSEQSCPKQTKKRKSKNAVLKGSSSDSGSKESDRVVQPGTPPSPRVPSVREVLTPQQPVWIQCVPDPQPVWSGAITKPAETQYVAPPTVQPVHKVGTPVEPYFFPPPRPKDGYGTRGRVIPLRINYFPIELTHSSIHMYHIDVFNDSLKSEDKSVVQKYVCHSVMKALLKKYQSDFPGEYPVYDRQAILYTKKALWGGVKTREFKVEWEDSENGDKKRLHRVVFTHVANINLANIQEFIERGRPYVTANDRVEDFNLCRTAIQAVEVIMGQLAAGKHVTVGRSFYLDPGNDPPNLGEGCDIWEGYFQSLRPGQWKPYISIDTTASAMMKNLSLLDFMCDAVNARDPREAMRRKHELQKVLCSLKVLTKHLGFNCVYKINNSARKVFGKAPSQQTFNYGDGFETTTEKYFLKKFKIKLNLPDIPCVAVGNKGTMIPPELLWVVKGQHKRGKLTGDQTANMIKYTKKPAFERERAIQQIANREIVINDPVLTHYGIEPSNRMLEVDGRVLDIPSVIYSNKTINPRDGAWNLMGVEFSGGKPMDRWGIIDFIGVKPDQCDYFIHEIQSVGGNSGMYIKNPLFVTNPRIDSRGDIYRKKEQIRKELTAVYNKYPGLQMIVAFINGKPFPMENKDMYGHIKCVCDSELGVNSQCIKDRNLFRINKSTIANICLKLNAKLGGVNHTVDMSRTPSAELFKRPIMIIGADVAHPGPGTDEFTPSIAAMVGSLDSKLAKYHSCVRFQKHERSIAHKIESDQPLKRKERLELIDKFEDMAYEIILGFQQFCNGYLPERILYYRDGVSESQFAQVLDWELTALRAACKRFHREKPGYEPAITIICCQKRHHLRMFCRDRNDQVGRGGNVPPGTCLDRAVTHNLEFDFFLCSHCSLQGTSRPVHYRVLWNENNFNANSLQALTYQLCHTYARCTKAVSIPAPVYYARCVAKRAAMSANFREDDTSAVSSGSSGDLEKWDLMRKPMLIDKGLMYWA